MAITITPSTVISGSIARDGSNAYDLFAGRVIEVQHVTETRNHSDTLDYTDHRSTACTYALVWLGTHGVPGREYYGRTIATWESLRDPKQPPGEFDAKPRELEYWEQFAWVDCTNLFGWRGEGHRAPVADATMGKGDPLMWANYLAWKAYLQSQLEAARRRMEEEAAVLRAAREAAAAKKAVKDAKLAAEKAAVEERMLKTPTKGTRCTVNGFTGNVFWKGVKMYRGKWTGTVGLKDAKGAVSWVDVGHWAPVVEEKKPAKKAKKVKVKK